MTRNWGAHMKASRFLFFVFLMFSGAAAQASSAGSGVVHNVFIMENGVVLFHLTGSRTSLPACGMYFPTRWAFDSTTPAGQAKLSFLMTVYASQKPIAVYGTSTCPNWADTETVSYLMTAD